MDRESNDEENLQEIINEVNRRALRDELKPSEVAALRELLPRIRELLEAYERRKWLFKSLGVFLLAFPAMLAMWQGVQRIIEWIRSP